MSVRWEVSRGFHLPHGPQILPVKHRRGRWRGIQGKSTATSREQTATFSRQCCLQVNYKEKSWGKALCSRNISHVPFFFSYRKPLYSHELLNMQEYFQVMMETFLHELDITFIYFFTSKREWNKMSALPFSPSICNRRHCSFYSPNKKSNVAAVFERFLFIYCLIALVLV